MSDEDEMTGWCQHCQQKIRHNGTQWTHDRSGHVLCRTTRAEPIIAVDQCCPGGCNCSCCYGYDDEDCHCFADPCNCGGNRAQHGQKPFPERRFIGA